MAGEIVLSVVAANCGGTCSDDLLDMVANGAPEVPVYLPRYEARGQVLAHAGGWQALVGTGADLIAYGTLLWAAYKQFVAPRISESTQSPRPAMIIFLSADGRAPVHFVVDDGWTELQLQEALVATVTEIRSQAAANSLDFQWDFSDSDHWTRYRADGDR